MGTEAVSLNTVLEYVDRLDIEDQQYLPEIIRRRLIDAKRTAIVSRANRRKETCGNRLAGAEQQKIFWRI
jgi:hypothetical protein